MLVAASVATWHISTVKASGLITIRTRWLKHARGVWNPTRSRSSVLPGGAGTIRSTQFPIDLERVFSFPFPAWAGRVFRYNETVAVYSVRADLDLPQE
jgi:hypothetical protein